MKASHYPLALFLLGTLTLGACSQQGGYPLLPPKPEAGTLHLAIRPPREATLRGLSSEAPDPLQQLHQLRLLFYSTGASPVVKEIREVEVTSATNLRDLTVSLPEGDYQLVVIGNPTPRLRDYTQVGSPLTQLTTPQVFPLDGLLTPSPTLSISMLNAGEAVAIAASAFGSRGIQAEVKLEPTLARVLLYGEPTLGLGASKGQGEAAYIIQPQAEKEVPLRPLGLLLSGGMETAGHRSTDADVYPQGPLFTAWQASQPTDLKSQLKYFPLNKLLPASGQNFWTTLATNEEGLKTLRTQPLSYAKETTLPTTAYLTGAVPSLLIRFPYIPAGLTLSSGEGWLSFQGRYYRESEVKAALASHSFRDPELLQALQGASITEDSFRAPFDKAGVSFYHQGYSYYTLPIRHYEESKAPEATSPGRYGLVRGNEYRIHLTRILRPGRAVLPDLSQELSPLKEEKELSALLEVRPLVVRTSEAHL